MLGHVTLVSLLNFMSSADMLHDTCHGVHVDFQEDHGLTARTVGTVLSTNASAMLSADMLHDKCHGVHLDLQEDHGLTTSRASPGAAVMNDKASATALSPFWESEAAFTADELHRARQILNRAELSFGHNLSFSGVPKDASTEWLYQKMLSLALKADDEAGWGLLVEEGADAADMMIYDRFGSNYTDNEFEWHTDAMDSDPVRRISVVAYFTPPAEYEGGVLQIKMPATGSQSKAEQEVLHKQYAPGWAVAFPSRSLEHGVTPVTKGERRSLLLIVGPEGSESEFPERADIYMSSM